MRILSIMPAAVITSLALTAYTESVDSGNNLPESSFDYIPFPAEYGYLENQEALQAASAKNDRKVIRHHGWKRCTKFPTSS